MSIMFRKAILPKNLSLLKYFKGRPLATAANKKSNGVLSALASKKNKPEQLNAIRDIPVAGIHGLQWQAVLVKQKPTSSLLRNASSPSLPPSVPLQALYISSIYLSRPLSVLVHQDLDRQPLASKPSLKVSSNRRPYYCNGPQMAPAKNPVSNKAMQHLSHVCGSCAPKCGPCCGPCNCALPAPCNTPPRCIQYMTGYYYYPYGFWFCGPYHVTGTCVPGGPVSPGGPCRPCPPNPGGPCGPCNPSCVCGVFNSLAVMPAIPDVSSSINFMPNEKAMNMLDVTKIKLPFDMSSLPMSCLPLNAPASPPGGGGTMPPMCAPCCACGPCCAPSAGGCGGPCVPCCGSCGPCGPCGPKGPFGPCGPCFPGVGCGCGGFGSCGSSAQCNVGSGCGCTGGCGGMCVGPCSPCGAFCGNCGCGCGGPCGPCCGPCGSCGPCGPCGSCGPCGPCGPCCGPCGPCGPCGGPCGPCGPCCGPCGAPLTGPCGCGACGRGPCGCGACLPFGPCGACCGVTSPNTMNLTIPYQVPTPPPPPPPPTLSGLPPVPNASGQWTGPCMNCKCPRPIPVNPASLGTAAGPGPFTQCCLAMTNEEESEEPEMSPVRSDVSEQTDVVKQTNVVVDEINDVEQTNVVVEEINDVGDTTNVREESNVAEEGSEAAAIPVAPKKVANPVQLFKRPGSNLSVFHRQPGHDSKHAKDPNKPLVNGIFTCYQSTMSGNSNIPPNKYHAPILPQTVQIVQLDMKRRKVTTPTLGNPGICTPIGEREMPSFPNCFTYLNIHPRCSVKQCDPELRDWTSQRPIPCK